MAKQVNVPLEESLKEAGIVLADFAQAVVKISVGMEAFLKSPLKFSTVVMLVARASNVNQGDVERVLLALPDLKKRYLKP